MYNEIKPIDQDSYEGCCKTHSQASFQAMEIALKQKAAKREAERYLELKEATDKPAVNKYKSMTTGGAVGSAFGIPTGEHQTWDVAKNPETSMCLQRAIDKLNEEESLRKARYYLKSNKDTVPKFNYNYWNDSLTLKDLHNILNLLGHRLTDYGRNPDKSNYIWIEPNYKQQD